MDDFWKFEEERDWAKNMWILSLYINFNCLRERLENKQSNVKTKEYQANFKRLSNIMSIWYYV